MSEMKETKSNKEAKKMTPKRIAALLVVVLLVAMYLITLFAALFDPTAGSKLFALCLYATVAVPLMTWITIFLIDRNRGKRTIGDPVMPPPEPEDAQAPGEPKE
ncbi:MAG: hypothetical protein K5891_05115 [Lachnospiraceae bacterium]|nr:hypothetical protein [Lachnospiraceae bacterium]